MSSKEASRTKTFIKSGVVILMFIVQRRASSHYCLGDLLLSPPTLSVSEEKKPLFSAFAQEQALMNFVFLILVFEDWSDFLIVLVIIL